MGRSFIVVLRRDHTKKYWEIKVGGLDGLSVAEVNDFHEAFPPFKAVSDKTTDGGFIWTDLRTEDKFPPIDKVQKILNQLSGGYSTVCTSTSCIDTTDRQFIWTLTRN